MLKKRIKGKSKISLNLPSAFICETLYAIAKISIRKLFIYPHLSESQEAKDVWEVSAKGWYMRTKFGYAEVKRKP